jgi:hypothetical protein
MKRSSGEQAHRVKHSAAIKAREIIQEKTKLSTADLKLIFRGAIKSSAKSALRLLWGAASHHDSSITSTQQGIEGNILSTKNCSLS